MDSVTSLRPIEIVCRTATPSGNEDAPAQKRRRGNSAATIARGLNFSEVITRLNHDIAEHILAHNRTRTELVDARRELDHIRSQGVGIHDPRITELQNAVRIRDAWCVEWRTLHAETTARIHTASARIVDLTMAVTFAESQGASLSDTAVRLDAATVRIAELSRAAVSAEAQYGALTILLSQANEKADAIAARLARANDALRCDRAKLHATEIKLLQSQLARVAQQDPWEESLFF
jgi:hypothetical protein